MDTSPAGGGGGGGHCYSSQFENLDFLRFQKGLAGTLFSLKLVKLSSFSDENQSISAKNRVPLGCFRKDPYSPAEVISDVSGGGGGGG